MKEARWQEISRLYFQALEMPDNERDAFLRTCKDEDLRQEDDHAAHARDDRH